MKLHRILYLLLAVSVACFGQKTSKPKAPKTLKSYPQDTAATYSWVRAEIQRALKSQTTQSETPVIVPDVVVNTPVLPPISSGVRFIANGTGNSIDFNDPDGISHDKKEQFKAWVQGENGVDAVRLAFSWGEYNPREGVYRNEGLTKAINWVKNLRPENPPKIRLLFVPILGGGDARIPSNEIQVDNNGNVMDCTYNSLFTTVPSYFSQTATALLGQCYDVLFPFLYKNFAGDIEVVELAAGQSEEHYMPFTSQAGGNPCGTFSGIGDYSQASKDAFRRFQTARNKNGAIAELPNVGVTQGYNWNMDYSQERFRDAALFWGSGISGIWDRFRVKAKQYGNFRVGMVIPDLLNDQGAKWLFHGFALPAMLAKCDVLYHSYNLSQWQWHGNLLGSDLLEGTRPNEVISEIEFDPYDCGTNNGFGSINEDFVEKSMTKIIEHGGDGIHFSMTWDGGQISQMKRVIGKVRGKNLQPKLREAVPIEVRASEIYQNSYFLDSAWKRSGNDPNNPFAANPVRIKLINDL
jgi:hypothetical protein